MPTKLNLTNKNFGKLLVLREWGRDRYGAVMWLCRCECGNEVVTRGTNIKSGVTRSCGCGIVEAGIKRNTTHGMSRTAIYLRWQAMRARCQNVNMVDYRNYGGRGIVICEKWQEFRGFYEDMGASFREDYELERLDVNGNYEPGNCAWVSRESQQRNRRNNHRITLRGETKTLVEWEIATGIKANTILTRIRRGWQVERALTKRP